MNLTVFTGFTSKQCGSSKSRSETKLSKGPLQSVSGSYFFHPYKWPVHAKQPESSSKQLSFLWRQK